jgi:hypothetical protein
MGLEGAIYEFQQTVPLLDHLDLRIRELSSERLTREGTLDPTSKDEHDVHRSEQQGATLLMRSSHATFRIEKDARRLSRWVDLTVSLDGTKVSVDSNYTPLFKSACDALRALGGNPCGPRLGPRKSRNNGHPSKGSEKVAGNEGQPLDP